MMVLFKTMKEARAYRDEMERQGMECTIEASLEGFDVRCRFVVKEPPKVEKEMERMVEEIKGELSPEELRREYREELKERKTLIPHEKVSIPDLPELRAYQKGAVNVAMEYNHALIILPTGSGKTEVALAVINRLHEPAIVVTPTIQLVYQWVSRIKQYGGRATAVSSEGRSAFSPLTVITYASALKHLDEFLNYRVFVFDEVHHLFAPEYRRIISYILRHVKDAHVIGMTASPRTYGAEKKIQDEIFPHRYEQTIAERQKSEYSVELNVKPIPVYLTEIQEKIYSLKFSRYYRALKFFGFDFRKMARSMGSDDPMVQKAAISGMVSYNDIKKLLSENPEKLETAAEIIKEHSGQFIVFGDTIDMVDTLWESLESDGINAIKIHSKMSLSRSKRDEIIDELRTGKARVLVGAIAIEEGLDIPDLDNAIFMSIVSSSERRAIQRLGRILRPRPGKVATLYILYAPGTIEQENLVKIMELLGVHRTL